MRHEVFPAGRRKQHASRVLHPETTARVRSVNSAGFPLLYATE